MKFQQRIDLDFQRLKMLQLWVSKSHLKAESMLLIEECLSRIFWSVAKIMNHAKSQDQLVSNLIQIFKLFKNFIF